MEISVKFKFYVEHVKDNFEESKPFIYCIFPNSHISSAFIFFCLADICRRLTQKGKDVAFLPHIVAKRIDLLKQHANYPFQQSQSSLIVKYLELTISLFLDPLHEKEKCPHSLEMDQEVANCLSNHGEVMMEKLHPKPSTVTIRQSHALKIACFQAAKHHTQQSK